MGKFLASSAFTSFGSAVVLLVLKPIDVLSPSDDFI